MRKAIRTEKETAMRKAPEISLPGGEEAEILMVTVMEEMVEMTMEAGRAPGQTEGGVLVAMRKDPEEEGMTNEP